MENAFDEDEKNNMKQYINDNNNNNNNNNNVNNNNNLITTWKWQFQNDSNNYIDFDKNISFKIEQAFMNQCSSVFFNRNNIEYYVNGYYFYNNNCNDFIKLIIILYILIKKILFKYIII